MTCLAAFSFSYFRSFLLRSYNGMKKKANKKVIRQDSRGMFPDFSVMNLGVRAAAVKMRTGEKHA